MGLIVLSGPARYVKIRVASLSVSKLNTAITVTERIQALGPTTVQSAGEKELSANGNNGPALLSAPGPPIFVKYFTNAGGLEKNQKI